MAFAICSGNDNILRSVETIFAGERRSSMPARFVDFDRQTPMFLPYDLRRVARSRRLRARRQTRRHNTTFTGFAPDRLRHKSVFHVSRDATHKSDPNGASHLTRSMEDEVRRAPCRKVIIAMAKTMKCPRARPCDECPAGPFDPATAAREFGRTAPDNLARRGTAETAAQRPAARETKGRGPPG